MNRATKRASRRNVWVDPAGARVNGRAHAIVLETLEETRNANDGAGRYRDRSVVLDATASGNEKMLLQRGGFWNATEGWRASHGIAPEDASRLAQRLRAEGVRLRNADADALLMAAERDALRLMAPPPTPEANARKKNAARERARSAGRCIVCTVSPARDGRTTCQACSDAAKGRMTARRAAAKGLPAPAPIAAPETPASQDDGHDWEDFIF